MIMREDYYSDETKKNFYNIAFRSTIFVLCLGIILLVVSQATLDSYGRSIGMIMLGSIIIFSIIFIIWLMFEITEIINRR